MTWKSVMDELGGGDVLFLGDDQESVTFIVFADLKMMESTYQKQKSIRLVVPIITDDGPIMFIMGKRLTRKLSKQEQNFGRFIFTVIREGGANDTNTRYRLTWDENPERVKKMRLLLSDKETKVWLAESFESAKEVLSG